MKRMHKTVSLILVMSIWSLFLWQTNILAVNNSLSFFGAYNLRGEKQYSISVILAKLLIKDENGGDLLERRENSKTFDVTEKIMEIAEGHENFIYMDMRTDSEENPYPEIEPTSATIKLPQGTGNIRTLLGKNYRLYYSPDENSEYEDVSYKITDTSQSKPQFSVEKLGVYILCFNPKVYNATFYLEEPVYEDDNWVNEDCVYKVIEDLEYEDTIEFPEAPQNDGYVFTGWKAKHFTGGGYSIPIRYTRSRPIRVSAHTLFFATWCPEDEYEPINIEISANKIIKGKEDGKKITLTTNYEVFADEEELNSEPEYWKVIGSDEITIELVKRINDKKLELTLSGNSSDKYDDTDIYIEFHCGLISSDEKIKMDEDGVTAEFYRSDNAITLKKQNKPNSGGGGGGTRIPATVYAPVMQSTVVQDNRIIFTIGRNEASVFGEVVTNDVAPVIKDDRTFLPARFVAESLGAEVKWDEELKTVTITKDETEIVITIDSETATVNGETVTLDSPAFIENDRTYTPVRFVAEMLGAKVEWTEELQTVTITK